MTPEQLASEADQKDELLFVLHHRDAPTVVFLECNSYAKREELASFLRQNLTEYQFFDIDVTPFPVVSLLRVLTEHLPTDIVQSQPVQYVVNVFGLENSLLVSEDGQIKPSQLTAQLNLERELLFRNVPYIIIIWADHLFFQTLQRESPDLWSWVVYRFRFEGSDAIDPEKAPPIPPERLPQRGNIAERQQRIDELKATYNHLNLNTSDKKRLLKDKVSILKLLAQEHAEAFQYDDAQVAYESAIAIADRMQEDNYLRGSLRFGLADLLIEKRQFSTALLVYQDIFPFASDYILGVLYHSIGITYQKQRYWDLAIENYLKALEWKGKTDNVNEIGITYHQLGMVYEDQKIWNRALENYKEALAWYKSTDQYNRFGSTYHQLGMVYQGQQRWDAALKNYQEALSWKKKTGNVYELGNTYDKIGLLCEEQHKWGEAVVNYQESLFWKEKTGNTYSLGGTYRQIGLIFDIQQNWPVALGFYHKALVWQEKTGNILDLGLTYGCIGTLYQNQKNLTEAIKWHRAALVKLSPFGSEELLMEIRATITTLEDQLASKPTRH